MSGFGPQDSRSASVDHLFVSAVDSATKSVLLKLVDHLFVSWVDSSTKRLLSFKPVDRK
jgi:hypothetical protein